jgi:hypothetical protein
VGNGMLVINERLDTGMHEKRGRAVLLCRVPAVTEPKM